MAEVRPCLGSYENEQGKCGGCPVALLCIDITIAADGYYDSLAERQREIEIIEQDGRWCEPCRQ